MTIGTLEKSQRTAARLVALFVRWNIEVGLKAVKMV